MENAKTKSGPLPSHAQIAAIASRLDVFLPPFTQKVGLCSHSIHNDPLKNLSQGLPFVCSKPCIRLHLTQNKNWPRPTQLCTLRLRPLLLLLSLSLPALLQQYWPCSFSGLLSMHPHQR